MITVNDSDGVNCGQVYSVLIILFAENMQGEEYG